MNQKTKKTLTLALILSVLAVCLTVLPQVQASPVDIIVNGSFENGETGWTRVGSGHVNTGATYAHTGEGYVYAGSAGYGLRQDFAEAIAGTDILSCSVWVRYYNQAGSLTITIYYSDESTDTYQQSTTITYAESNILSHINTAKSVTGVEVKQTSSGNPIWDDLTLIVNQPDPDTTPPTYSNLSHSNETASAQCTFNITCNDEIALSHYTFSQNITGSWQNTTTQFTTTPETISLNYTLPSENCTVAYQWFFNDTSNNWNNTDLQTFNVFEAGPEPDTTSPTYSNVTHSTETSGESCRFNITVTDETALSQWIFAHNITGTMQNVTSQTFYENPETVSIAYDLPLNNCTITYQWFFNDTSNNWNSTEIYSVNVTGYETTPTLTPSPTLTTPQNSENQSTLIYGVVSVVVVLSIFNLIRRH
ncbi:MAG: hypothetical protein NWF01_08795 [Candidatus Bathyarchaeota archaeon]|nr:hypothetical protein [Candidatus Bathyarchaeota archaeon]